MTDEEKLIKEWEERVKQIPVTTIKNEERLAKYVKDNGLTKEDLVVLLTIVGTSLPEFRNITVKPDSAITFGELLDFYDRSQAQFIIIHRCNYILHELMITVYDILEKEKRLRFTVKKNCQDAEKQYHAYVEPRRKRCERTAWCTLQDHLRITHDFLSPMLEKVYESIRDYMIRLGWRDVEVRARIEVALLLAKVARHSFNAFFKEFEDACGCDFSKCYTSSDLRGMVMHFAKMSDSLGFKTVPDKYGLPDLKGFDVDANVRVKWAWNDFINALQDEDLMDESARRAIELNPKVEADYKKVIEEAEAEQMEANAEKLSEKFKVTKMK